MVRFSDIFKKKGSQFPPPSLPPSSPKVAPPSTLSTGPERITTGKDIKCKSSSEKEIEKKEPASMPHIRIIKVENTLAEKNPERLARTDSVIQEGEKKPIEQHPSEYRDAGGTVNFAQAMRKPSDPLRQRREDEAETTSSTGEKLQNLKEISLAKIIRKEDEEKPEKATKLYGQIGGVITKILEGVHKPEDLHSANYSLLLTPLDEAINLIITGDRTLLDLIYQSSVKEYFKFHLTNVGVISLYIGHGNGYNKSNLTELGVLSFLHDIEIKNTSQALSPDETESDYDTRYQKIWQLSNILLPAFKKERNAAFTNRLPGETSSEEISEYMRVVAVADTYETLCRPQSYRKKISPQFVIKELIESIDTPSRTGGFDKELVKILIKLIGLYPVGSWVELNTGEIGRVIRINEKSPLRPTVHIILNEEKHRVSPLKTLDLMANQNIYIKASLSEDEIKGFNYDEGKTLA